MIELDTRPLLVAYATKHGSTREVAEAVAGTLAEQGFCVDLRAATAVDGVAGYGAFVVGGALYTGRWHRDAVALVRRLAHDAPGVPVALFALGPRTLAPEELARSEAQLRHSLRRVSALLPVALRVFGGVVRPDALRFPFSRMPASDARDWDAVESWARELALRFGKAASSAGDPRSELQQTPR